MSLKLTLVPIMPKRASAALNLHLSRSTCGGPINHGSDTQSPFVDKRLQDLAGFQPRYTPSRQTLPDQVNITVACFFVAKQSSSRINAYLGLLSV
jgi:hypothetical protein